MENLPEKTEKATSTSVAIEGATIKTVRETKKLTQLYVASVVGVTTDTISRWENNRYPTIKRENAEKLATALEVPLEEILRDETAGQVEEVTEPFPVTPAPRFSIFKILPIILLLAVGAYYTIRAMPHPPVAVRWMPPYAAPGDKIPVQITVSRKNNSGRGLIIKEKLPPGWRLMGAIPPVATGKVLSEEIKWLIPGGNGPVKVSYVVHLPAQSEIKSKATLAGTVLVDTGGLNRSETIVGKSKIVVDSIHWADSNGDGRIDDNEIMPAYYLTEEMRSLGLDFNGIEAIWSSGGYKWNPQQKAFEVAK